MRTLLGISVAMLVAVAIVIACSGGNVGAPCELTRGGSYCKTNIAERNVASDCDDYWCISYQGSRPYCSKECSTSDDCPDSYRCLRQDYSSLDPSLKGTYFCIPKFMEICSDDKGCNPDNDKCNGWDYYCPDKTCQHITCKACESDKDCNSPACNPDSDCKGDKCPPYVCLNNACKRNVPTSGGGAAGTDGGTSSDGGGGGEN